MLDIEGLWSAGIFYYTTFEESFVAFMNNNLGFFFYMNLDYDEIELFKWKAEDCETISINGIGSYSFEDETLEEIDKNTVTNLKNIKFRKCKRVTFYDKEIHSLEFSQPLVSGDLEFGLEEKDVLSSHIYKRAIELIGENLPEEFKSDCQREGL